MPACSRNDEQPNENLQTPLDEMEESATNNAENSAETMLVAVEAVLTETRETVEALSVSALQHAHTASHTSDVTAESFFQAHQDMTMTSKEQAHKKQLDLLESMKLYEEVCADELPAGTHVMSGRWGGRDENTNGVVVQVHSER